MHSKQRYKICICLVILGELNLFEITSLGLQYHFTEKFGCNQSGFTKVRIFLIPLESENFKFPFSTKNSLTWRVKCEKLNFRKS